MAKKRKQSPKTVPARPSWETRLAPLVRVLPFAVAGVYFAVTAYLVLRYHRIGGFGVETDFYAELVPQARALLRGEFDPLLYGNKGPVYSVLLAGTYLVIREYFLAGMVLNLVSAAAFLVVGYYLVRVVFNTPTAAFFILACAANPTFQTYTTQAGSDMPFLTMAALALLFMFHGQRHPGIRGIPISGFFASLAFLTRYNGIYLAVACIGWIVLSPGLDWKDRSKGIGLWLGVFIIAGLPWFIPNAIATGNPVHNDNHVNVMMEYYGGVNDRDTYEAWVDRVPEGIDSLGEVILYDPPHFAMRFAANLGVHLLFDLVRLLGIPFGILTLIGIILTPFARPGRRILVYLSSGAALFAILALIFYNERFSLPLLAMYLPLAVWPLTEGPIAARIARFRVPLAIAVLLLVAAVGIHSFAGVHRDLTNPPPQLTGLKALGESLSSHVSDPHTRIAAREPHIAHYAGITPRMFPEHLRTPQDLVAYCHDNGIRFAAYTAIEYTARPHLRMLWEEQNILGLTPVVWNDTGLVFEVE